MKQVIVIHGGTTFSHYEKYLEYLRTKKVYLERMTYAPSWKQSLQSELGSEYQVLLPSMPNSTNAQYNEWKLWFDRIAEVADDDCILIGHSLGAIFLAKYLSENIFSKKIIATILIAAPFSDESGEDLTDFKLTGIADQFTAQAGRVVFFSGEDDPVIPMMESERYRAELPDAEFHVMSAPDHFVRSQFPELLNLLRTIG